MIEIIKGDDMAYNGRGYTPREQGKRVITHDLALAQVLKFLETQPAYNQFVKGLIDAENAKIAAEQKAAAERAQAAKNAMIDSAVKEKEAQIAKLQAEAKELAAKKFGGEEKKTELIAPKAEPIAEEPKTDDLNGDGKISKDEIIARFKKDGVVFDANAHWKTLEKQYKEKYGNK